MKTSIHCIAILTTLVLGAAACDPIGSSGLDGLPAPEDALEIAVQDIATIEYEGGHVAFQQFTFADGGTAIVVSDEFENRYPESPLLTALGGRNPTSSELYLALRPGEALPAAIASHQQEEAMARGRDDFDLEMIEVEIVTEVAKLSPGTCDTRIYRDESSSPGDYTYTKKRRRNDLNGTRDLAVGNSNDDYDFLTGSPVTMGACNDSSSNMTAAIWVRYEGGDWSLSPASTVRSESSRVWLHFSDLEYLGDICGTTNSDICLPQYSDSSYAVRGTGSDFHLRTALSSLNPPIIR